MTLVKISVSIVVSYFFLNAGLLLVVERQNQFKKRKIIIFSCQVSVEVLNSEVVQKCVALNCCLNVFYNKPPSVDVLCVGSIYRYLGIQARTSKLWDVSFTASTTRKIRQICLIASVVYSHVRSSLFLALSNLCIGQGGETTPFSWS